MIDYYGDEGKCEFSDKLPARVLIAEDDLINQAVVKLILEEIGCQVEVVSDGKEVLEILGRQTFDIIFLDVQMPGLGGVETTRQIRNQKNSTGTTIRIYAMTGNFNPREHKLYREAGMNGCITKPVSLEKILSALKASESLETTDQELTENSGFDSEKMVDLQNSLGEDLRDIILTYLDDVPRMLGILREMFEIGNIKEIHRIAHSIKSSSGIFGANRMAEACYQIEIAAKNGRVPDLAVLERVKTEFLKVKDYLEKF